MNTGHKQDPSASGWWNQSKPARTLRGKLVKTMLISLTLFAVATLVTVAWMNFRASDTNLKAIEGFIRDGIEEKGEVLLQNHALALKSLVADNAYSDIDKLVRQAVENDDDIVYGLFVSNEGVAWVYAYPGSTPETVEADKTAWKKLNISPKALKAKTVFMRKTSAFEQTIFEFSLAVADDEETYGTVIYGLSDSRIVTALNQARTESKQALTYTLALLIALTLLISLLSLFFAQRAGSKITEPLSSLTRAANAMASGERKATVDIRSGDELETLAGAFNKMVQEVVEHRENLESLVEQRTAELKAAQADLMKASRLAGMAEIAQDVLHNIGNTLNSVNVSAALIKTSLEKSTAQGIAKAIALTGEHRDNLAAFFSSDPKGKDVFEYLELAVERLLDEHEKLKRLSEVLLERCEQAITIVTSQHGTTQLGTSSTLSERCSIDTLISAAVKENQRDIDRGHIKIDRSVAGDLQLVTDRQKLLDILTELIANGVRAVSDVDRNPRQITVSAVQNRDGQMRIEIADNGVGIAQDKLMKIFNHGFADFVGTRGFGLHQSFNSAVQLGGLIEVSSEGIDRGATVRLTLNFDPQSLESRYLDSSASPSLTG